MLLKAHGKMVYVSVFIAVVAYYLIDEGIGKDFYQWLYTSCGGGKTKTEVKQIAKRSMKFLMECTRENESGNLLQLH